MSEYDLDDIERNARAARVVQKGSWFVSCARQRDGAYDNVSSGTERDHNAVCTVPCASDACTGANAAHIAGLDPAVVLAMCADLRRLDRVAESDRALLRALAHHARASAAMLRADVRRQEAAESGAVASRRLRDMTHRAEREEAYANGIDAALATITMGALPREASEKRVTGEAALASERPTRKDVADITREEAERFFARIYDGLHKLPSALRMERLCGGGTAWSIIESVRGAGLSTFDHDVLTRLVFLAHDEGVRLCLRSSSPGRIRIEIAPRDQSSLAMSSHHPSLDEAVGRWRRPDAVAWPRELAERRSRDA